MTRDELERELRRCHVIIAELREHNSCLQDVLRIISAAVSRCSPQKQPALQAASTAGDESNPPDVPAQTVTIKQTHPRRQSVTKEIGPAPRLRHRVFRSPHEPQENDDVAGAWTKPRLEMDEKFKAAVERERRPATKGK
jgi:hypothetical protein